MDAKMQENSAAETGNLRQKFDALPMPAVNSAEIRSLREECTVKGAANFASCLTDFFKSKGLFGKYRNEDRGWDDVEINRSSVKSVNAHGARDGKNALLGAAPQMIWNGIYLETNPKNDQGLVSHVFASKAAVDGVPYAVAFVVLEDHNGRRYYEHCLTEIRALDQIDDQAPLNAADERQRTRVQNFTARNAVGQTPISEILKKHLTAS